jgi:periplasmic divalent cation tolerance protein
MTNCPDEACAQRIADRLVAEHASACVNIMPGIRSVYEWRGRMEHASEVMLFIKTTGERYRDVESTIRAEHPYELPEVVAVPLVRGLRAYFDWVRQCVQVRSI